jgi:signal transduction histidine kinase
MALWLRTTTVAALAVAGLATALSLAGAVPGRAGRWGIAALVVQAAVLLVAAVQQRRIVLVERGWDRYSREVAAEAVNALRAAVAREVQELERVARAALDAPDDAGRAFVWLDAALGEAPRHRGVVLERSGRALAWAGELRARPDPVAQPVSIDFTPFYTTLRVAAAGGGRRAVASAILHAEGPADRLTRPLDLLPGAAPELRGFEFAPPIAPDSTWLAVPVAGRTLLTVHPVLLEPGEAIVRLIERARVTGMIGLTIAGLMLLWAMWRRPASVVQRLFALAAALVVTSVVPFNAFSNVSPVFNPGVYFAAFGGPLTGNLAALAVSSALVLLGFFALGRSGLRLPARWPAVAGVLAVASLGPFLLRDLARGIALPALGASITLWLSWQIAIFLAAAAILLAGSSAGRFALGGSRGLPPALAPLLASVAALLAPIIWLAPGRWPDWYTALWIVTMGALALARRSRALVLSVGIVAACGATTLVWGFVSRRRVELAQADVNRLTRADPSTIELIQRFAVDLASGPPPVEREELLLRFVRSPLAAAGHPLEIASWLPGEEQPHAELLIADFERRPEGERALVTEARATGEQVWRTEPSPQGTQTVVAIPHPGGAVTTLVVVPRSLLIPDDPFTLLVGLAPPVFTEPPYDLTVTTLPSPSPLDERPRWVRRANELHGDWRVPGASESARVHVEVELRGLEALLPRGALIVLLDLVVLGALWTLAAASDGALPRWARQRARRWVHSYRGRLTVTLFTFFVIPAAGFALWSYRRLLQTDRESRVLLLRETLRTIASAGDLGQLAQLEDRFDTPLLEYREGRLQDASDGLYESLAPVGRYLPPEAAIGLGVESEVLAVARPLVAGTPMLFGYRTVVRGREGDAVLAAPARTTERALDRERRDIGILVLFVTSLGGLAALALSGLAARELERPVGSLRLAALRIARGERFVPLHRSPAVEFVPVFSAFERMDAELAASRAALLDAQRRTEAVLRNVASGVIALDAEGRVSIANRSAEAILGRALAPGSALADLGAPWVDERARQFLSGQTEESVFDVLHGKRQLRGSLTRLTGGAAGAGGVVLTLDDVTDLARAQRVLAWGEMARQVAHEIKNPLTPIRLGVQHLQRARGDPRVHFDRIFEQNVSRILEEIDRLDEIARAFSRYGLAPAEQPAPDVVDVAAVVRDVVDLEQLGVSEVTWHVAGVEEPAPAMARDTELREVLLNLLENARQARARNVTVSVERLDHRVDVVVVDDGDGIPAEILARIFEPQFSTRTSGSGLGLAISRGLVAAWGGEMNVTSERGRGTEMRITLPAATRP